MTPCLTGLQADMLFFTLTGRRRGGGWRRCGLVVARRLRIRVIADSDPEAEESRMLMACVHMLCVNVLSILHLRDVTDVLAPESGYDSH